MIMIINNQMMMISMTTMMVYDNDNNDYRLLRQTVSYYDLEAEQLTWFPINKDAEGRVYAPTCGNSELSCGKVYCSVACYCCVA